MKSEEKMHDEWEFLLEEYFYQTASFSNGMELQESSTDIYAFYWRNYNTRYGDAKGCVALASASVKGENRSVHTWNNKVAHLRAIFNLGIKSVGSAR